MSIEMQTFIGVMIPLLGTTLGAGLVFVLRDRLHPSVQKLLLGFAAGVMIAASIWSLIIPGINMAEDQGIRHSWIPAATGFLLGMGMMLLIDTFLPHVHPASETEEGMSSAMKKSTKMIFAVTLHNFPEGLAVGAVFAGMLSGDSTITMASAYVLCIGIAIQNFPEGMIISMPLASNGMKKSKAFLFGAGSGIVEPLGAFLMIAMSSLFAPILPYFLSFAAGAMIYVVVEELIPESQEGDHSNIGTIGVALGFALMMILDVALG